MASSITMTHGLIESAKKGTNRTDNPAKILLLRDKARRLVAQQREKIGKAIVANSYKKVIDIAVSYLMRNNNAIVVKDLLEAIRIGLRKPFRGEKNQRRLPKPQSPESKSGSSKLPRHCVRNYRGGSAAIRLKEKNIKRRPAVRFAGVNTH